MHKVRFKSLRVEKELEAIPSEMQMSLIEMRGIVKHFSHVLANDKVDFSARAGEIHALVGENGAGKSTLMKILYGLCQPDAGKIYLRTQPVNITSPRVAIQHGIGMVHQHFMLIPTLTVLDNTILGLEPRKLRLFLNLSRAREEVSSLAQSLNFELELNAKIEDIPVGLQQRAEILKVLYHRAEILILDEPTSVLTPQETEGLFQLLISLKARGKTVIFISHKLNEVLKISDFITVMRAGRIAGVMKTSETCFEELSEMVMGKKKSDKQSKKKMESKETVLSLRNLSLKAKDERMILKDISFDLNGGEILGVAGVEGNGQSELVGALTGLMKISAGEILLNGEDISNFSAKRLRRKKLAHIPADRQKHGLISQASVNENFVLGQHDSPPFNHYHITNRKAIGQFASKMASKYDINIPDFQLPASTLSGGNQQKVVVARELEINPRLIIAAHPTRGLDIGAANFVHQQLIQQRNAGKAILLVSADLEELLTLSDRIAVMYNGQIVSLVSADETDEAQLGMMMLGKRCPEDGRHTFHTAS